MMDLSPYMPVVVSIVVGVLIVFAVAAWRMAAQWARSDHVKVENEAYSQVITLARVVVLSAEQMLSGQSGKDKLDYVLGVLDRLYPNLDEDLIRAIVEAAVFDTKKAA